MCLGLGGDFAELRCDKVRSSEVGIGSRLKETNIGFGRSGYVMCCWDERYAGGILIGIVPVGWCKEDKGSRRACRNDISPP